jgi:hypothetical protein
MLHLLIALAVAQPPVSQPAPSASPSPTGRPTPECDPFVDVCPEYTSGELQCEQVTQAGRLIVNSPNTTAFYYIGTPINITISYTRETNRELPRNEVVMYYRNIGNEDWTEWGSIPRGESTIFRTLNNVIPGSFEVFYFD